MQQIQFKAIGTQWEILIEESIPVGDIEAEVLAYVQGFEKRFSRFLPDSEVNAFRESTEGTYAISEEFAGMLTVADRLRVLTDGVFNPASGELLERAGYGKQLGNNRGDKDVFELPKWELDDNKLILEKETAFDLGGIGKGYCIDKVANILREKGVNHYLVDAGGDIYATTKLDGLPWKVAVQYPGKPDIAAGVVYLKNQGLAVSDSFRRRWGKWHHIVNPKEGRPIEQVIGAAAVADSAWNADCMTSCLFMAPKDSYPIAAQEFDASYLVFKDTSECIKSNNWEGEVFV